MDICQEQLENPNPSLYNDTIWDAAKGNCTYLRTNDALLIGRLSCGISVMCFMFVIYIISISPIRLSTIYHRLILALSISGVVFETAAGLATLPMPSPGDYWTDANNFPGTRIGNTQTCTMQGFLIMFGYWLSINYFGGLCLYYLCAIGFKMTVDTLSRYIEPLIHILSIFVALLFSLPPALEGNYNASFDQPYCVQVPKPWFCNSDDVESGLEVECERGGEAAHALPFDHYRYSFSSAYVEWSYFVILSFFLAVLCWQVYHAERKVASLMTQYITPAAQVAGDVNADMDAGGDTDADRATNVYLSGGVRDENTGLLRLPANKRNVLHLKDGEQMTLEEVIHIKQFNDTKFIALQALLYLMFFPIVWTPFLILYKRAQTHPYDTLYNNVLMFVSCSDGVFVLGLFLIHKIRNLRRLDNNISICDAIGQILQNGGGHDSCVMTSMHLVKAYDETKKRHSDYRMEGYGEGEGEDSNDISFTAPPSLSFSFLRHPAPKASTRLFSDMSLTNDITPSYGATSSKFAGSSKMMSQSSLGSIPSYWDGESIDSNDLLSYPSQENVSVEVGGEGGIEGAIYQKSLSDSAKYHTNLKACHEEEQEDDL